MARCAPRRRQVLAYVKDCVAIQGRAPSYKMIGNALGFGSDGEVRRIVAALESEGRLKRTGKGRVRRIHLT